MSLKRSIYLINFITTIIPIIIISIVSYYIFAKELERIELEKINSTSRRVENIIEDKITFNLKTLNFLEKEYLEHGEDISELNHNMGKILELDDSINELAYGTKDGKLYLGNKEHKKYVPKNYDLKKRPWYIGAKKSNEHYLSGIYYHVVTNSPTITLSKKIEKDNILKGVLVSNLNLKYLKNILEENKLGKTGGFFIVDYKNNLISSSEKNEEYDYLKKSDFIGNLNKTFKVKTEDKKMLYSIYRIKKVDLYLVGYVSEKEVEEPIYKLRKVVILIVLITIIISSLSIHRLGKLLDNSIKRLAYLINSVSKGNYTKDLDEITKMIGKNSELKLIKESIKNMTDEVEKREEKLTRISIIDPLTKAYNRRHIMELLKFEINKSKTLETNYILIMFDLDKFKNLNDNYGHLFGDEVLEKISEVVAQNIKGSDKFGRYGGEEFFLILPNSKLSEGILLATRLRKKIEKLQWKYNITVSVSMGVTENKPSDNIGKIIKRVDNLLYKAKENGRNRIEF